jgi:two-component system nitrogen regulation response regulator GlnG
MEALRHSRGNKAAVARLLHLDYKTVHTKLKVYGLST